MHEVHGIQQLDHLCRIVQGQELCLRGHFHTRKKVIDIIRFLEYYTIDVLVMLDP